MKKSLILVITATLCCGNLVAENNPSAKTAEQQSQEKIEQRISTLEKPLYSAFTERYILDELKQLRIEMAEQKVDYTKQIVDREHTSVDRAVTYATDTVTYFFYLIAAATSVLVLVGWSSIRDIKDRVHSLADEEINSLVKEYSDRLHAIETQLNQKTEHIKENRDEIELTQEVHSLWLKAGQDIGPMSRIEIYDQILALKNDDCEALTYKADAALEIDETQWAINLCHQALSIDPENSHAFYQLACAHALQQHFDDAIKYLKEALKRSESYRETIGDDPALAGLHKHPEYQQLLNNH